MLQFAFSPQEQSSYLPHNCPKRAVIYTGTHDNDTSRGWARSAGKQERRMAATYMGVKKEKDFAWGMVRTAWVSPCELAIAPMQDFLNLPSAARMNTPSTVGDNWAWRMEEQAGQGAGKKDSGTWSRQLAAAGLPQGAAGAAQASGARKESMRNGRIVTAIFKATV